METETYPVELPAQIAALLTSAIAIDVRRAGRGRKAGNFVERIPLRLDDGMVTHNKRTDASDEEIAALVWTSCTNDAHARCGGSQLYRVTFEYAKPRTGPSPSSRTIDVQVGEPEEDDEGLDRRQRREWHAEIISNHRSMFDCHIKLLEQTTKLAKAVSDMAIGLVGAHESIASREREQASSVLEHKLLDSERASDAEKMDLLKQFIGPTLALVRAKLGITETVVPQPGDDPAWPEIVKVSRAFARSLTTAQLDTARRCFGTTSELEALRDVTTEADALRALATFYARPQGAIVEVYFTLDPTQQSHAETLQRLTAEAGDRTKGGA